MPTFDAQSVARLLRASSLSQAEAAAIAIQGSSPMHADAFDVSAENLARTYSIRLRGLREKSGAHAKQLAASVEELCQQLRAFAGQACWLVVPHVPPARFVILLAADCSRVVGCMLTVARPAVTDAEWAHLWDDERHN
jgi:hypothetical protein